MIQSLSEHGFPLAVSDSPRLSLPGPVMTKNSGIKTKYSADIPMRSLFFAKYNFFSNENITLYKLPCTNHFETIMQPHHKVTADVN